MRQWTIDFLKALELRIPPPEGCHYAIMRMQYGSDETGWRDELGVHMRIGERMENMFLEDEDFLKVPDVLATEIIGILNLAGIVKAPT